jgi:chromosome segregation ATPase
MGTETLETVKLMLEIIAGAGAVLGSLWAMITRPIRKEISGLKVETSRDIAGILASAKTQFREIRDEMKAERAETKASLTELKAGQQALAMEQNGDHLLLGRLEKGLESLDERANMGLTAQRAEIDHTKGRVEDLRREVDGIRRDMEYMKGRVEHG